MAVKKFSLLLAITGTVFLCLGFLLAGIATANRDIIGGADLSTFFYVFSQERNGLYQTLSLLGVLLILVSVLHRKTTKRS